MFQFPVLASCYARCHSFRMTGCPIRKSSDQRLFAPARSLSQLITSFIASESQGIRHAPLLTFFQTFYSRTGIGSGMLPSINIAYSNTYGLIYTFSSLLLFYFLYIMSKIVSLFQRSWRITDSNRWPSACKADALASWANPPRGYQEFCFLAFSFRCSSFLSLVVPGRVELPTSTLSV